MNYDRRQAATLNPLGQFRVDNPQQAPKLFEDVASAYKAYYKAVQRARMALDDAGKSLVFASVRAERAIDAWGKEPVNEVAPSLKEMKQAVAMADRMLLNLQKDWKAYGHADELTVGPTRVRIP